MKSAGKFLLLLLVALLGVASPARAARDDERIAQLKDEIRTLEVVAADNANAAEHPGIEHRLEMLRAELTILEKRQDLELQELGLRNGPNPAPREQLHEKLQSIPLDTTAAEARLHDLVARRAAAV